MNTSTATSTSVISAVSILHENTTIISFGYWGPPSSTIDWCEMNYVHSYYIAEFWNTWSNVSFLCCALYGFYTIFQLHQQQRQGQSEQFSQSSQSYSLYQFYVLYSFVFFIGIGSAFFHSTLCTWSQQFDELPMIWGVLLWYYILYQDTMEFYKYWILLLTITVSSLHFIYHFTTVFQCAFTFLSLMCARRIHFYYKTTKCLNEKFYGRLYFITLISGGLLWLIDYHCCSWLRKFSFNPQFHAWWHLLMGLSCHYGVTLTVVTYIRKIQEDSVLKKIE